MPDQSIFPLLAVDLRFATSLLGSMSFNLTAMFRRLHLKFLHPPLHDLRAKILNLTGHKRIGMTGSVLRPLKKARNEIRILTVQPCLDIEEILVCDLEIVSLGKHDAADSWYNYFHKPVYEALSYTWGNEPACVEILLNGQVWMIRSNLNDALRQLRKRNEPLRIFVDALCIDQNNLDEKNWQVRLMSRIYRRATMVHCWLGPATETSAKALELLRLANAGRTVSTSMTSHPVCLADLRSLSDMLRRPYWQRAWVIQESTLATQATFHCGSYSITKDEMPSIQQMSKLLGLIFDLFGKLKEELRQNSEPGIIAALDDDDLAKFLQDLYARIGSSYCAFAGIKATLQSNYRLSALYLTMAASQLAQDPRDHVYAFLGLLEEEMSTKIEPAYEESVAFAFQQLAFQWLAVRDDGELLSLAIGTRQNGYMLRSWVPDFSSIDLTDQAYVGAFYEHNTQISSGAVLADAGCLGIQAHAFDKIVSIHPLNDIKPVTISVNSKAIDNARMYHISWRPFFGLSPDSIQDEVEYLGGGSLENAYWRTLTAQIASVRMDFLLEKHITALKAWLENVFEELSVEFQQYVTQYGIMLTRSHERYFFKTQKGYLGRTDNSNVPIVEGDEIYLLASNAQPFVCRPREGETDTYTLVQGTYIHGLMQIDREYLTTEEERAEYGPRIQDVHPQTKAAGGKWEKIWLA